MKPKLFHVFILALLIAGCVTSPSKGRSDLLDFLTDGKTAKQKAVANLGQPSGKFEGEKILTYRLGFDVRNRGYYVTEPVFRPSAAPVWIDAKYSLVLVFDDQEVLKRHSLVEVVR